MKRKCINSSKLLALLITLTMIFSVLPFNAYAEELTTDYTKQKDIAITYLTAAAENEWLNADNDLTQYLDLDTEGGKFAFDRTDILRNFRKLNENEIKDFNVSYNVEYTGPKEFNSIIKLVENISFIQGEKDSHYNNTYNILIDDKDKIVDVNKLDDWFERTYRTSGKTKEIIFSELTKELINNMDPDVNNLKNSEIFKDSTLTKNIQYMMYDVNNAISYANTYSGSTSEFYNLNFDSYAGLGGDCMNFASQSIWAGLGGTNSEQVIDSNILFNNYSLDNNYNEWNINSGPWLGVWSFYNYMIDKTPKDNGLVAMTWRIEPDQWDLGIDPELLLGSIALVPGGTEEGTGDEEKPKTEFGHAVVITQVDGTTRDKILFNAHTTNRASANFSTHYKNTPIFIVRPIYYKLTHNCLFDGHMFSSLGSLIGGEGSTCIWCGYNRLFISNKLLSPMMVGDKATLASKASMNVFKMSIKVESPSGEITWLRDEYNTNFIKRNFTFTEPGMYKITTFAQDTNDILSLKSVENNNTYYVRVTDGLNKLTTTDSEYIDSDYFNDNTSIDFIPSLDFQ